jgi:hypothetical protein
MNYTPDIITELEPHQVFVFGSNSKGIHKKGAALMAYEKFGAVLGIASGIQGSSYAIVTKKDWKVKQSSTLMEIKHEIAELLTFAEQFPEYEFLVTKIGTGLGGYTVSQIRNLFLELHTEYALPDNIVLPEEFEIRQ